MKIILTSSFFSSRKKHRSKRFKTQIVSDKLKIKFIPSPGYRKNISVGRIIDHIVLAFNLYKLIRSTKDLPDIAFIGYPPVETAFIFSNWLRKRFHIMLILKISGHIFFRRFLHPFIN